MKMLADNDWNIGLYCSLVKPNRNQSKKKRQGTK